MASARPKNFGFVIGAAKSGTTALFDALRKHPEICGSKMKEPHFFSFDETYALGIDYYLSLFSNWDASRHKVALDASATYSHSPKLGDSARRIHEFDPGARFIYIMRNPFERIRSHNQMFMTFGREALSASQGVEQDYLNISKYHYQISRYRQYFPREALLLLTLDQMVVDPEKMLLRIFEHLGVKANAGVTYKKLHSSDILYSMYFIKRALIERGDIEGGATTRDALNYFNGIAENEREEIRKIAARQFDVNEVDMERFRRALSDDMKALADEYGINVAAWGF